MKIPKRTFLAASAVVLLVLVLLALVLMKKNTRLYEEDEYHELTGTFDTIRISNPFGNIRLYPSKDRIMRIMVDLFSERKEDLNSIDPVIRQEGQNVTMEMVYNKQAGRELYADFTVSIPDTQKIVLQSEHGNVWAQDIHAHLDVAVNGKTSTVTILNVKGAIDILAEDGDITLEMPDKTPLKVRSKKANTYVTFMGEEPGNASIHGKNGQCIMYLSREADATIKAKVNGTFTSNMTRKHWNQGTIISEGEPIEVRLGKGSAQIEILQEKGELVFDQQLPETLLSRQSSGVDQTRKKDEPANGEEEQE